MILDASRSSLDREEVAEAVDQVIPLDDHCLAFVVLYQRPHLAAVGSTHRAVRVGEDQGKLIAMRLEHQAVEGCTG